MYLKNKDNKNATKKVMYYYNLFDLNNVGDWE